MTRPKELRPDSIEMTCRVVSGHMAWLECNAERIALRGNADCDEAIGGRSYEGVNRGGNDATHPERYALTPKPDASTNDVVTFNNLLIDLAQTAAKLRNVAAKILPAWDDETLPLTDRKSLRDAMSTASKAHTQIGAGACKVCTQYCSGARNDRLVSGRCDACLKYWDRHHRNEDRPRELWEQREAV